MCKKTTDVTYAIQTTFKMNEKIDMIAGLWSNGLFMTSLEHGVLLSTVPFHL